ncbi:MAG: hypothetical protein LBF22_13490 [Deltaproteobacteria bacterium]|nr:hypothetical protein [Deltaproteobacteria bacterium]
MAPTFGTALGDPAFAVKGVLLGAGLRAFGEAVVRAFGEALKLVLEPLGVRVFCKGDAKKEASKGSKVSLRAERGLVLSLEILPVWVRLVTLACEVLPPTVFTLGVFTPAVFALGVFTPTVFTLGVFTPAVFALGVFTPAVFTLGIITLGGFKEEVSKVLLCESFSFKIFLSKILVSSSSVI